MILSIQKYQLDLPLEYLTVNVQCPTPNALIFIAECFTPDALIGIEDSEANFASLLTQKMFSSPICNTLPG